MTRLFRLANHEERRVDILESYSDNAAFPVTLAKHTADCNIITAEHLCIAYPQLTNQLKYQLMERGQLAAALKTAMQMRKFQRFIVRKSRERRLFDRKCMVLSLGGVTDVDRSYWMQAGVLKE